MIFNMAGGGSSKGKLKIELATTLPESVTDKKIVVVTDNINGNVYFSAAQPDEMVNGDVWVRISEDADNYILLEEDPYIGFSLVGTWQMSNGSLSTMDAYYGLGDEWVQFSKKIINADEITASFSDPNGFIDYGMVQMGDGNYYRLWEINKSGTLQLDNVQTAIGFDKTDVWLCGGGSSGQRASAYNYTSRGGPGAYATDVYDISLDKSTITAVVGSGGAPATAYPNFGEGGGSCLIIGDTNISAPATNSGKGGTGGGGNGWLSGSGTVTNPTISQFTPYDVIPGDGIPNKRPFNDSYFELCCSGGGAGYVRADTYLNGSIGGNGGENGGDGTKSARQTPIGSGSPGIGGLGGGKGGAMHNLIVENDNKGYPATRYGCGGGGSGTYHYAARDSGTGYQGVIFIRILQQNYQPSGDPDTLLLLHGETLFDSSIYNRHVDNHGVTLAVNQSKFGGGSLYFNGSSHLEIRPNYNFEEEDFTIDWWEYATSSTGGTRFVSSHPLRSSDTESAGVLVYCSDTNLRLYASRSNAGADPDYWDICKAQNIGSHTLNTWVHRAIVRKGNALTAYVDGVQSYTQSITGSIGFNPDMPMAIGMYSADPSNTAAKTNFFTGYIEEFRISKVARWSGNFTPPTSAYSK